jgi:hypothetical protein
MSETKTNEEKIAWAMWKYGLNPGKHKGPVVFSINAMGNVEIEEVPADWLKRELVAMLTRLEWTTYENKSLGICPVCSRCKQYGHSPDCALAALLKKARPDT